MISEAEAEEYLYINLVVSLFFSAYLTSLYLLYHARVDGGWRTGGSLRKFITNTETTTKVKMRSLLIGEVGDVNGALYLILTAVAIIWLFGVAQRPIMATILFGFVSKQIFFSTCLLDVNLSFLSDQGFLITRLPVFASRQPQDNGVPLAPDVSRGQVAGAIAGSYALAAWFVAWLLSGEPLVTGRSAAVLNQASDPEDTFGNPGSLTRMLAHFFELIIFGFLTERLGRILCSLELLRMVLRQRLASLVAAGRDELARADALLLSDRRLASLNSLLLFSALPPPGLLVMVLITDLTNIAGRPIMQWYGIGSQITAVWCVAFTMCLIFLRVAVLAVKCGTVTAKDYWVTFTISEKYVASVAGLCFVSAAVRVVATGN